MLPGLEPFRVPGKNLQIRLDGRFAMEAGATTSRRLACEFPLERSTCSAEQLEEELQIYHQASFEESTTGCCMIPNAYIHSAMEL